jgi:AraC-like DNA-binding protein
MQIAFEKLGVDAEALIHCEEFRQSHFTSPFHIHDEFELILIQKGTGKLYVGNHMSNFRDGDLFLFSPGLPHCFYNSGEHEMDNKDSQAVVILFRKDFLGVDFYDRTEGKALGKLIQKSDYGVQFLSYSNQLIERIQALNQKKNLEKLATLLFILNELAAKKSLKLLTNNQNSIIAGNLSDSKSINRVIQYVVENFQDDISFSQAAALASMQKAAFCRFFKRKTKKTFTEFVNEVRITHAQKLLSETDLTVGEIAFGCGYKNLSYFNRLFKQYTQLTPGDFRQFNKEKYEV